MIHVALWPDELWPDEVVCYTNVITQAQPFQERTYVPKVALEKLVAEVSELEDEIYGLQLEIGRLTMGESDGIQ